MDRTHRLLLTAVLTGLVLTFSAAHGGAPSGKTDGALSRESTAGAPWLMAKAVSAPSFEKVAAVLDQYNCKMCHRGAEPREGLRLDSYENLMKGSKDGPVVIPGDPGKSELILRVKGSREPRMPIGGPPWLTDEAVKVLEDWIAAGARAE